MSDESTHLILGDAAAAASEEIGGRRRLFRRRKKTASLRLTNCENCGAPLAGEFCSKCGQHAIDYRRSLARVLVDAADSIFNWDTKFLKSVGVLLVRPWQLTNDFNSGRRVRYVHPLRLYLLASIAFFLLARLINFNPGEALHFDSKDRLEMEEALAKLAGPDSKLAPEERAKVEAARARLQITGPLTAGDEKNMRRALGTLIAESVKENLKTNDHIKLSRALDRVVDSGSTTAETPAAEPTASPSETFPTPTVAPTVKKSIGLHFSDNDEAHKESFEKWMENRMRDKLGEDGTKSQLFLETLRSNVPTMMLCCIPVFAFVLKALYFRQRRFYIEHLVYSLHIHSFAYVAVVVTTLLAMAAARWNTVAQGLTIAFFPTTGVVLVFLSIRRVYRQGWFFTTFKFFLGGLIYFVILITAVALTAVVTLLLPN